MRRKRSAQSVSNRAHTSTTRVQPHDTLARSGRVARWTTAVPHRRAGDTGCQLSSVAESGWSSSSSSSLSTGACLLQARIKGVDSLIASLIPVWLLHPCAVLSLALLNVLGRQERLRGLLDELAGARDAVDRALFHPDVLARDRLTHLLSEKRRVHPSLVERKGTIGWCTLVAVARGIPDQRRNPRQSAPISVQQR